MTVASLRQRGARRTGLLREQALVAGAQVASGVGNLLFALVAVRLLAPGAFADLAAFLALYLVVCVPATSLSAGGALTPAAVPRARRRALAGGLAAAAALALAAIPLAPVLGVPVALLLVLAAGVPAAPWLALERGRLYGERDHGRVAASLVAEPVLRLGLGIPLCAALGATGGAAGVVAGGWLALAVTRPGAPNVRTPTAAAGERTLTASAWVAAAAFLALALVHNQDVVLANALLDGDEAGRFAVLSTLGGVAAFASTTVPLVLLPRAQAGERGALAAAVGSAAALGAAAVLAVALMPADLVGAAFGDRYASIGALAVPYVAAMAFFGVARVLVAHRCATEPTPRALVLPGAIMAAHALAIVAFADSAASVATITLLAMVALVAGTAGGVVVRLPVGRRDPAPGAAPARRRVRLPRPSRAALAVAALTGLALVVRAAASRGIWLDEATSISQAQLPFGEMMERLRTLDVHPPLHHAITWALAHTLGTEEAVMRAPSYVAGAALVPVLYLTGTELWDRRAGLAAAAMGTLAPFLVWYAQEARMYALFMLFATLALLGQLRALRTNRPADWALYVLATAALLWTQYFGLLVVAVQQVGFLLGARRRPRLLRGWLPSLLALALLVAPLAPLALDQFQANEAAGRGFDQPSQAGADVSDTRSQPGVYVALTNLVWALWGYHSNATMAGITALWPLALLAALLLLGRGRSPRTLLVAACALVPMALLYVVGEVKPFLFEIRYFAALAPLAVLLIARAATSWTRRGLAAGLATGAVLASFGAAYADQQINSANPRVYDFEGTLTALEREVRPGDVVLYEPRYLNEVVRYYAPELPARPLGEGLERSGPHRRVFVLGSFLEQPRHRDAIDAALEDLGRTRELSDRWTRPQVEVWVLR